MKNLKKNFVLAALATTLSTGAFASANDGQLTVFGCTAGFSTAGVANSFDDTQLDVAQAQLRIQEQQLQIARMAKIRDENNTLKSELGAFNEQVASLQQQIAGLNASLLASNLEGKEAARVRDFFQTTDGEKKKIIEELQAHIDSLRTAREEALIELNNILAQANQLKERIDFEVADKENQLAIQKNGYEAQLAAKQDIIHSRDTQLEELKEQLGKTQKKLEETSQAYSGANSMLQMSNNDLTRITNERDTARKESAEKDARIAELERLLQQERNGNATRDKTISSLKAQLAAANKEA